MRSNVCSVEPTAWLVYVQVTKHCDAVERMNATKHSEPLFTTCASRSFYTAGQIKQSSVVNLGSISRYRRRTSRSYPKNALYLPPSSYHESAGHLLWHSQ